MKFVIEHLSKKFGEKEVLKDIDFSFESGKIYGLLGRNGAGKTTLFNCINRDIKFDGGQNPEPEGYFRRRGNHQQPQGLRVSERAFHKAPQEDSLALLRKNIRRGALRRCGGAYRCELYSGGEGGDKRNSPSFPPVFHFCYVRNKPGRGLYPGALYELRPQPSDLFFLQEAEIRAAALLDTPSGDN